jgi:hypothetical protein
MASNRASLTFALFGVDVSASRTIEGVGDAAHHSELGLARLATQTAKWGAVAAGASVGTLALVRQVPERLRRFDPAEWEVPPEPAWWGEDWDGLPWRYFKARLAWQRARQAWEASHGVRIAELFDAYADQAAAAARTVEDLNEPYGGELFCEDERPDPRAPLPPSWAGDLPTAEELGAVDPDALGAVELDVEAVNRALRRGR